MTRVRLYICTFNTAYELTRDSRIGTNNNNKNTSRHEYLFQRDFRGVFRQLFPSFFFLLFPYTPLGYGRELTVGRRCVGAWVHLYIYMTTTTATTIHRQKNAVFQSLNVCELAYEYLYVGKNARDHDRTGPGEHHQCNRVARKVDHVEEFFFFKGGPAKGSFIAYWCTTV